MARIYFDPDEDELVSTRKLTAKERAAIQRMLDEDDEFADDDFNDGEVARIHAESLRRRAEIDAEMLCRMDDLEDAIRENTEAVQMNGLAAQDRYNHDLDTAATIAGGIIGFKAATGLIDGFFDAINPFSSGCDCKKKKWF